ncbi:MAG: hypothetical protein KJI72_03240 [Patescibacteria group bacterium]|nr:hypothetical protein [Patescibacteria group bacterium]
MLFDRHHFHFFGGKELNSLYVTIGLIYFAEGLISVFIPIYFWQIGFPFWRILFFYLLKSLFFVAVTFSLLPVMRKLSDKMMMFLSIPFIILYFFGLGFITDIPFLFYILPLVHAFSMLFFNVGYHMDFSSSVDDDHVGQEVGTRYMVGALTQFSSPFIGGVIIGFLGFQYVFLIGSGILLLAVLPLFFFPRRNLSPDLHISSILTFLKSKSLRSFNLSGFGYATEIMVGQIVWPIFIFLSVGSIQNFGGVISIGLLASVMAIYFAGFMSDVGRRRKILSWTTGLLSLVWVIRPLLTGVGAIVGSHVGGNVVSSALMVSWSSQYYKIARAVSNKSLFILSREILYHVSRILFLPLLIILSLIFSTGGFFKVSFLVAAVLALFFLFANKQHMKVLKDESL